MNSRRSRQVAVSIGIALVLIISGTAYIVASHAAATDDAYRHVFGERLTAAVSASERHFAIYLDIDACLACTEDMEAWIELENGLPQCGCSFSLWAPRADSFDVAYAMELEGLNTPVRALSEDALASLRWGSERTPLRALLDTDGRPLEICGPMGNPDQSRQHTARLLERICSEE